MREVSVDRRAGEFFFVATDGRCDPRVNAFLRSRHFLAFRDSTQTRYCRSIGVWLNFLDAIGVSWERASPDDIAAFMQWRTSDGDNPRRVAGNSAHADLAAVAALYDWSSPRFGLPNPVVRSETSPTWMNRRRVHSDNGAPVSSPAGVRDRNVKWLDPPAVNRWVDLALRGFGADGQEPQRSRNRTGGRDAGYAHLLYGSGLRRTEAASLLLIELPEQLEFGRQFWTQRLAAACGKGHRGRSWWIPRAALSEVVAYRDIERADAVARARRRGAYTGPNWLEIEDVTAGRRVTLRNEHGDRKVAALDEVDPLLRLRLLVDRGDGPEPAMLWLNENGTPRPPDSWNATFATGNERTARLAMPWFACTPHMLRHSFALRWYAVGRLLWDKRLEHLTADEQRDYRSQFGDTWTFVQTLLGHANPQTTVETYLEPFKGLETQLLLDYAADIPISGLLEQMLTADPRILRDPLADST